MLRNVRCVPSFRDSLLSVSQLWEPTSTEWRFGGTRAMFSPPGPHGQRLSLPLGRAGGLYIWRVLLRSHVSSSRPARAMAIH
eukprot:5438237-Pleurochrysis_carterae.AAC.1